MVPVLGNIIIMAVTVGLVYATLHLKRAN